MAIYESVPTLVEAEQFSAGKLPLPFSPAPIVCFDGTRWYVVTIHGQETTIVDGDWIIREAGTTDKAYPCKPDVFARKYRLKEQKMEGLTVGRMVHYVAYGTPKGEYRAGAHRAAIVAELKDEPNGDTGLCVLLVINPAGIHFNTAPYSEDPKPGTWHWIERA